MVGNLIPSVRLTSTGFCGGQLCAEGEEVHCRVLRKETEESDLRSLWCVEKIESGSWTSLQSNTGPSVVLRSLVRFLFGCF